MVQEFQITRGGKTYKAVIGVTEEKETRLYLEDDEPGELGLKVRKYILKLEVIFEGYRKEPDAISGYRGNVAAIRTEWAESKISPTGEVIPGTATEIVMITNQDDIKVFTALFGNPILMSGLNGLIRDSMGFNHLPVFDTTTGQVKEYSPYEESTPPTGDYNTYKIGDPKPEILNEPTETNDATSDTPSA
jgi:hypothetical protein